MKLPDCWQKIMEQNNKYIAENKVLFLLNKPNG